MEAILAKSLSFSYPKTESAALTDVSFSIAQGEFCLVSGASAAGKSTLLKLLKKEIAPAGAMSGTVTVNGTAGYVSQNIEESLVCDKVRSELSFGLTNMGVSAEKIELQCAETASYFHLEDKLEADIAALSGGDKQMVNLAAVMMMKPDVLLLDEPCSQLDPISTERFVTMLQRIHRDFHTTILISEHSAETLFGYADKVLLLEEGRLLISAPPHDVLAFLQQEHHPMLEAVPPYLRIQDTGNYRDEEARDLGEPILKAKHLYFAYEKGNDILKNLSYQAYRGKINAIVGPNAGGKTTLLKVLSGVFKPYSGKVKYTGNLSMLTQNVYDLFTKERCSDEVPFGALTDRLGISDIASRHPYDLSGGQAQRLALAKVLSRNADIIVLDEPTKGLDALLKIKLGALLRDLCKQGKTVILVTHDIEFAGRFCDNAAFLSRGSIVAAAPRRAFFSSLSFYTTALARMTKGSAVSAEDMYEEE